MVAESKSLEIRWLRTALRDFDTEISFIAADDPESAHLVARRILQSIAMLSTHSAIGRPGRVAGTRELIVADTRYVVPYRVRNGMIEILRIFHASRRPPKRW